jgi:hypothetical protein
VAGPPLGRQRSMARFSPQPEGLGPILRISSSLLAPRTGENWLPAPPAGKLITGSSDPIEPAAAIPEIEDRFESGRRLGSF